MSVSSSLDKDQIKVVIHEVTRWLDLAEEGDWMTLPGITGRQEPAPRPGSVGAGRRHTLGVRETYSFPPRALGIGSADARSS